MFRRHDLSEENSTFTWHFSGWVWGRNDWDQVCSWRRFVTGIHVHCHVRVSGTYWPCSDLLRIDLTACEGLNLWTVSCSIKNFMISFEKCWYSWFTFQQLHPDTDDSVSEPEEEEVLTWSALIESTFNESSRVCMMTPKRMLVPTVMEGGRRVWTPTSTTPTKEN